MKNELTKKASGRILEILEDMWKSDCEKREKRAHDKWRMKEIWQLDYVRKYGNNIVKEKSQKKPKTNGKLSNKSTKSEASFADVVRQNFHQKNNNRPTKIRQQKHILQHQEQKRRRQTEQRTEIPASSTNEKRVEPKVINLSSKQLNEWEIKLLSKGLKYTPTPNSNKQELKKDIKEYTRRLRLAEYFNTTESDESDSNEPEDLVRNKSNFNPKKGRNGMLDTVCETLQSLTLDTTHNKSVRNNLSKNEEKALRSLASDKTIIIKEADKGVAVVIMNAAYYERKITHMLSNTEFYTEVAENQDKKAMQKIKKLLHKHSSVLSEKEEDFVDFDSQLVTLDVVNLYTNITSTLGIKALNFWIENYRNKIDKRFTKEFLLEATELVLKNNVFTFNDKYFHQVKGTAMGTKMAPTYATLTLGYLEEALYEKANEQFDAEFCEYLKRNWKRYLDDCFIIWKKDDSDLNILNDILNELDPDIKFTMEKSSTQLPFLDVLICKENNKIATDIFYKSTDTHQYLHFGFSHPRHIKRAIPYNLARRICTIVSEEETRNQRLDELKIFLTDQHYPLSLINDGIRKAKELDREELINPTPNDEENIKILPLVTTYNPKNPNITPIVQNLNEILKTDEEMSNVLSKFKFINSKRQPKNLRRILCPSKITKSTKSVTKCKDPRCGTCSVLREGTSFNFRGKDFFINSDMT
ncbi:uncharacterized protein LOC134265884, partial [Saccostrea cucullata]|uniref:uncharacterized protein LOC134265884 n=1 Tax=Saccostrea cuccullata TaxID=36930 RepID=UPI002ED1C1C9